MNHPLLPRAEHGGPQGAAEHILDFSVNTNPLGPNPELVRIWRAADPCGYPDPHYRQARRALADHHGVDPASVVLGVGASELLHRIVRAFVHPGDMVISLGAPFGELVRAVALQGAQLQVVDRTASAPFPPAPLIYFSNPHSPTTHVLPAARWPQAEVVIVDEAYAPFLAEPAPWPLYPNVIRVQSPGKAHGLLGLRLAYALAHPELAAYLENLQPSWAIPGPVAEVLAALPEQTWFLQETLGRVRAWSAELAAALGATPTGLHFFTIPVNDAPLLAAALLQRGIRVRDCTSFGLPGYLRVAAQRPQQNHHLVRVWHDMCSLHHGRQRSALLYKK